MATPDVIDAFYVKNRPQGCDALKLVLKHRRVFIGYPPWRKGKKYGKRRIRISIADLSEPNAKWEKESFERTDRRYKSQVTQNRNYALAVRSGAMVVVPRPGEGMCYVAQVKGVFELVNSPSWADEYLEMRKAQGLSIENMQSHIGDVVQSWPVTEFTEVPFPRIPRWISYSLLNRTQRGRLRDQPGTNRSATDVLRDLYRGQFEADLSPSSDQEVIQARLLDWTTPRALEHIVCDLLQCEYPALRWQHVGGSGDGGADGLAVSTDGSIVAALQCKWKMGEDPWSIGESLRDQIAGKWGKKVAVYVAALYHPEPVEKSAANITFLGLSDIAGLLLKHQAQCAAAKRYGCA